MTFSAKEAIVVAVVLSLTGCGSDDPEPTTVAAADTGTVVDSGGGVDSATPDTSVSEVSSDVAVDSADAKPLRKLNPDASLKWYGTNRTKLDEMIAAKGKASASYDPTKKPVAAFDWDNTMIKNDIGDATMFWMVAHNKILQPPSGNWRLTSPYLTTGAATALASACPTSLAAAGTALPTSTDATCAKELVTIYTTGKTVGLVAAFSGWNYRRIEPTYAWLAQLAAGYTAAEAKAFATSAMDENLAAAKGDTQKFGPTGDAGVPVEVTHWIRIYDEMKDLVGTMQENGFDVWVISASPQWAVEPMAAKVGVAADHVIGIRNVEASGKLTSNIQGCGDVVDGTNDGAGTFTGNSMISYIDGKRCWLNKVVFGDTTATAVNKAPEAKRQVFAAGDSDTDITFLQDATTMKLVLNRNKKELMCNGYGNADSKWLVNPMFVDPKPQYTAGYPCTTAACKDSTGTSIPCVDEKGANIPDQTDTVFVAP